MKSEVICPDCGMKRFKLVNTVAAPEVVVKCAQCGKRIGQFSAYGFTEEEAKSAKGNY